MKQIKLKSEIEQSKSEKESFYLSIPISNSERLELVEYYKRNIYKLTGTSERDLSMKNLFKKLIFEQIQINNLKKGGD